MEEDGKKYIKNAEMVEYDYDRENYDLIDGELVPKTVVNNMKRKMRDVFEEDGIPVYKTPEELRKDKNREKFGLNNKKRYNYEDFI